MMKHYLFYDQNHDEKIFRYKVNYLWFFLAIIMFVMALVVIKTEIELSRCATACQGCGCSDSFI